MASTEPKKHPRVDATRGRKNLLTESEKEQTSRVIQEEIKDLKRQMQELQRQIHVLQGRDPMRNRGTYFSCPNVDAGKACYCTGACRGS